MDKFEQQINTAYKRFARTAQSYYYTFSRPSVTVGGTPSVIFLGNHSSGKSSLINWILGEPPVQDTGVAPTDDGFTVIMYGEQDEDIVGPAALARLPEEFRSLEPLGPAFLQHLRVKARNRELLKRVNLVDSPGMIDSATAATPRDYDFSGAVTRLAQLCDIVFFLFDPEKPGTTGETVNVFANCLKGVEFKLRVLLNKCDAFTSTYDFARAYGTLCWNLSRVLHTKDLPKIFTTYSGKEREPATSGGDFSDFNRHRAEFKALFDNPGARRTDSVFAAAYNDFACLSMRMRVVDNAARKMRKLTTRNLLIGSATALLAGGLTALVTASALDASLLVFSARGLMAWIAGGTVAALVCLATTVWSRIAMRKLRSALAQKVDDIFTEEHRTQTAIGTYDDLSQRWNGIRAETADIIDHAPLALPLFAKRTRAAIDRITSGLLDTLAKSGGQQNRIMQGC